MRLLDEARAIEALLDDVEPEPDQMEQYWNVSLRLIRLVMEIEEFADPTGGRSITVDDAEYIRLRKALVGIENEVLDLTAS